MGAGNSKSTEHAHSGSSSEVEGRLRQSLGHWRWPLKDVSITSHFGPRGKRRHEGIDLRAGVGTRVYSTASGQVVYSGRRISGYGKMIVIKHPGDVFSVYAHLSRYQVRKGARVDQGQLIGYSGKTGRVTGPHLHFEIRQGTVAVNPYQVLQNGRIAIAQPSRAPWSGRPSTSNRNPKFRTPPSKKLFPASTQVSDSKPFRVPPPKS